MGSSTFFLQIFEKIRLFWQVFNNYLDIRHQRHGHYGRLAQYISHDYFHGGKKENVSYAFFSIMVSFHSFISWFPIFRTPVILELIKLIRSSGEIYELNVFWLVMESPIWKIWLSSPLADVSRAFILFNIPLEVNFIAHLILFALILSNLTILYNRLLAWKTTFTLL